jgi:hypothetical protein
MQSKIIVLVCHIDTRAHICDWLVPSQLLIKSDHLSIPLLIKLDIPEGSGQLVLALGPTTHIMRLNLVT